MKYSIFSEKSIIVLLLAVGFVTHFAWFGNPASAVFDEVHFGKFITSYFTHEYYFDIHPPLGKLILAGWGNLWGFQPGFSFANIGDQFPDNAYLALRFLPALAGALLPLVIFGLARRLKMSLPAAGLAGVFVALDNALLTQSRLILLDSFLLLFGFLAFYCYLHWRDGASKWFLAATGILAGAAVCIKWTGITFLALIVVLEVLHLWKDRRGTARRSLGPVVACLVILPVITYVIPFVIHFMLLTKSGTGDAFMSTAFQHGLEGSTYASDTTLIPLSTFAKVVELNKHMYGSNLRLTATHPYSSKWYTWPLLDRPIFYWVQGESRIYLLGNPVVWWGSTVAVVALFGVLLKPRWGRRDGVALLLSGAWLVNMLPFIGIPRVMFLYHYFSGLIWAVLMVAWFVDKLKKPQRPALALAALALASFVFFAPLSYGLNMSQKAYDWRVWLSSWK